MNRKIDGNTLFIQDSEGKTILTIEVLKADNTLTLAVSGDMTHDAAPEFEDELMSCLTLGRDVIVDFSDLGHISAPALNTLLAVQKLVEEKRYKFYIQNISTPVKEIFEQTGFIDLIDIRGRMGD